ncbi:hypothetical protein TWF481_004938 [Arthrobotrys musiformis]|uniref:F-box domain-containing protein n=1 Tax=Arthrobotrys musiformis TaxID=47236 RepID=A0AAV9WL04_9PEZI
MFSITTLPVELQIQIFAELSLIDQISVAHVCRLWSSILATSYQLRKSRYHEIDYAEPRDTRLYPYHDPDFLVRNLPVHRLLYNKYQSDSPNRSPRSEGGFVRDAPQEFNHLRNLPRYRGNLEIARSDSFAYLKAIICQTTLQIKSYVYEIYLEDRSKNPDICPTKIELAIDHPWFDDLVFFAPNPDGNNERHDSNPINSNEEEEKTIPILHLLHLPKAVWQIIPYHDLMAIRISPASLTVGQLITRTWEAIRQVYLSTPHPYAEIMEYVRISVTRSGLEEDGTQDVSPALRLEVTAGDGYWEQVDRKLVWRGKLPEPQYRIWKSPDQNIYDRIRDYGDRLFTSRQGCGSCCRLADAVVH